MNQHQSVSLPFITGDTVRSIMDLPALVDAMAGALMRYSASHGAHPVRTTLPLASPDSTMFVMPAVDAVAAVKVVTLAPDNAAAGIPTHHAVVLAFDAISGVPIAIIDATYLTEIRTAAASAAAVRALMDGAPARVAIIGSGAQARGHVDVLRALFPEAQFFAWSRNPGNLHRFALEAAVTACSSAEEAIRGADLVIAATSSRSPVVESDWLAPGALVVSVGAPVPSWRELGDGVMANPVYVDSREACLRESGDIIATGCTIAGEIGEVLSGRLAVDRSVTRVFKSGGLAIEDAAAAALVIDLLGLSPRAHSPA